MIFVQLGVLLICIFIGARMSGIGLGMIGLLILLFVFGMEPSDPPLEVMLIYNGIYFAVRNSIIDVSMANSKVSEDTVYSFSRDYFTFSHFPVSKAVHSVFVT